MKSRVFNSSSEHCSRLLFLLAILFAFPVAAQTNALNKADTPLHVAVIDVQAVSQGAVALRKAEQEISDLRKSYQQEIARQQKTLEELERNLAAQKDTLTKEEMTEKARDFEKRAAALQVDVQERKQQLEQAFSNAMKMFQSTLVKEVGDYSEENNIDVVLRRSQVFIADKSLDITETILQRVNKVLPEIKVEPVKSKTQ